MKFEKKIDRLEEIVGKMEEGELSLDESLKLFEEGVKLSRECQGQLGQAEEKVQQLLKNDQAGTVETTEFKVD